MKLTRYEKETIILTNEEDDYYSVYTFNQRFQKRLKKFAEKYPESLRLILCEKSHMIMRENEGENKRVICV